MKGTGKQNTQMGKVLYFTTQKGKIVYCEDGINAEITIKAETTCRVKTVVRVEISEVFDEHIQNPEFTAMILDSMIAHSRGHRSNAFRNLRSDLTLQYPGMYEKLEQKWQKASNLLTGRKSDDAKKSNKHGGTGRIVFLQGSVYEHTASSSH